MINRRAWSTLLLLAMAVAIVGCNTPNIAEPHRGQLPELSLQVNAACIDSTGLANVTLTVSEEADSFRILNRETGRVVASGSIDGSVTIDSLPNGAYRALVTNETQSAESDFSVNCETREPGPGSVLVVENRCVNEDGEVVVEASRGFESYTLENLDTGETIEQDSGLDPEGDQQIEFNNLSDGDYRVTVEKDGREETVEFSVSCDLDAPGEITLDQQCVNEDGQVTATVERGLESYKLRRDGNIVAEDSGLSPEKNQQIEFSDLADGNYTLEVTLNDKTAERSFSVDCDVPGPNKPEVIENKCVNEDGVVRFRVDSGADRFEVISDADSIVDSGDVAGEEFEVDGLPDGDFRLVVYKNGKSATSDEFTVDCDQPSPNQPKLEKNVCQKGDGLVEFSIPDGANRYELIDAASGNVIDDGNVSGETLELSGLADGSYFLRVFRNSKTADSENFEVKCDSQIRDCVFTFTGDHLVSGKSKLDVTDLSGEAAKVILDREPITNLTIEAKVRISQGDQTEENFALGFISETTGDTIFTKIVDDPDNSGTGERWTTVTFQMDQNKLAVDEAYRLIAVHAHFLGGDHADGNDSVWFSEAGEMEGRVRIFYEFFPNN